MLSTPESYLNQNQRPFNFSHVNLSCGSCKTIRPFSGDPAKCDVCGWVCKDSDTHQRSASSSTDTLGQFLGKLLVGGFLLVCALIAADYWFRTEKQRLADEFKVPQEKVFIESKPHGCDFDDAPLGNKHCHFEKQVDASRSCTGCSVTAVYVRWRRVEE
jgi:hypothetical protein